jgi:periplasmic copper chaperone A
LTPGVGWDMRPEMSSVPRSPFRLAFALASLLGATACFADPVKIGALVIDAPWARATPKGADVGAAYLTIRNDGDADDRLVSATTDFATVQIHEMKVQDGVMKMRQLTDGLPVPAHGTVALAPGGDHLMLAKLAHPLTQGETAKLTLVFEHAGTATIDFPIAAIGAAGPPP